MIGPARLPVALIAAVARNNVIGAGNALPWRLPGDLRHFKAVTMGKPVVMGRRTYESIGKPLPGRHVIVVSRDSKFAPAGVSIARSLPEARRLGEHLGRRGEAPEVMVAGGGELYRALIEDAERLYITHVEAAPAGDTLFPPINQLAWREVERSTTEPTEGAAPAYTFVTYEKVAGSNPT